MSEIDSLKGRFGVLLPVSSLPGPAAVGSLGESARRWLDWLHLAGASVWQVLPAGPPGYGNSPYSSQCSFAADPQLVSIDDLRKSGWIAAGTGKSGKGLSGGDPSQATRSVDQALRRAWEQLPRQPASRREAFEAFRVDPAQLDWLEDWALFATLKSELAGRSWLEWPAEVRRREPAALADVKLRFADEIGYHGFVQFLAAEQMSSLRGEAGRLGIELLGDLPFYPALDSADVWAHPDLFDLTEEGRPRNVSGVPPDAFSRTGQLWGNPVYRWERHAEDGYRWWRNRVRASLRFVDWLRLDHFRGFVAYWAVPAEEPTAERGEWLPGPAAAFFESMRAELGALPFVAEDLGRITDDVRALRRSLGILGMRVLQFGFDLPDSEHAPHRVPSDVVVYTGTHDNDTTRGWFSKIRGEERRRAIDTFGEFDEPHWSLLRLALESPADWAVAPVQDLLGLGSEARLNTPGQPAGQWAWRLDALPTDELAARVRALVESSRRADPLRASE